MTKQKSDSGKFENALSNLEKIVSVMESGDLSLDDSLKQYEEGIKLIRFCNKKLADAEKKIEILVNADDETLEKINFDDYDPQKAAVNNSAPQEKKKDDKKEPKKKKKEPLQPPEEGMLF